MKKTKTKLVGEFFYVLFKRESLIVCNWDCFDVFLFISNIHVYEKWVRIDMFYANYKQSGQTENQTIELRLLIID